MTTSSSHRYSLMTATLPPMTSVCDTPALNLHIAPTFFSRLLGLHRLTYLGPEEGLLITPCRAIHTFFLHRSIDVVFLSSDMKVCGLRTRLMPNRIAYERRASSVVELPAGYCDRRPDYLQHIHAALQLRVFPRLSARAQSSIVQPSARSGGKGTRL